jgi:hypothetical protein
MRTYCQNKFVSSSRKASTEQPGLQLLTVQLAKLPISFSPKAAGSNGGSISIGTATWWVSASPSTRCIQSLCGSGTGVRRRGTIDVGRTGKIRCSLVVGTRASAVRAWPRRSPRKRSVGGIVASRILRIC